MPYALLRAPQDDTAESVSKGGINYILLKTNIPTGETITNATKKASSVLKSAPVSGRSTTVIELVAILELLGISFNIFPEI